MKVLYITYDGLTDFIGQSQILPYLLGCASAGHRLTIISFEKPDRRRSIGEQVEQQCRDAGMEWLPQKFRSRPPYLAKLIDQLTMRRAALTAVNGNRYDLLHCRSYPAAVAGLELKRRTGTPLLFDMRGFWPDQRREGGRWPDASLIGRRLYARWKRHEATFIENADHILVLTQAAKWEIQQWSCFRDAPVSMVPCCTDFALFKPSDPTARGAVRQRLGIDRDAPVLGYLGSIGTVYRIADHLRLFDAVRRRNPRAKALFIGQDQLYKIMEIGLQLGLQLSSDDLRVVAAERDQLPYWLGAMDVGSCFIVPSYSSLGVSPTKLAEYLACDIPVIANRAVGDVEEILASLEAGYVMPGFEQEHIEAAADAFFSLRSPGRRSLRDQARPLFDLPIAVSAYRQIYDDWHQPVTLGLQ